MRKRDPLSQWPRVSRGGSLRGLLSFALAAVIAFGFTLSAVPATATPAPAPAQSEDERVGQMIEQLIELLFNYQNERGNWDLERVTGDNAAKMGATDLTALTMTALLYAGVSPQDERLTRAIQFLRENPPTRGYQAGLDAHVWARMNDSYLPMLHRTGQWLTTAMCPQTGGIGYRSIQDAKPEVHAATSHLDRKSVV